MHIHSMASLSISQFLHFNEIQHLNLEGETFWFYLQSAGTWHPNREQIQNVHLYSKLKEEMSFGFVSS